MGDMLMEKNNKQEQSPRKPRYSAYYMKFMNAGIEELKSTEALYDISKQRLSVKRQQL